MTTLISRRGTRRLVRTAIGATATTALLLGAAASATTASAAPGTDSGLFGTSDPTYDGVYRQSVALIGLQAAGAKLPTSAVSWLTRQQCSDGSFVAYRPSTTDACPAADPVNFTGPDSNSTALAAMALATAGKGKEANSASRWLVANQNADGGWGYIAGSDSDANSTGLALAALDRSTNNEVKAERRGLAYLRTIAGDCSKGAAAIAYQAGQAANPLASAQALLGLNTGLPLQESPAKYTAAQRCTEKLDQQVAQYLANELKSNKGVLPSAMDATQPDYNTTSWSVIGLVGANWPLAQYSTSVKQLKANARDYVGTGSTASPAAAGTLAVVAETTGSRARSFGGVNLVSTILSTLKS